MINPCTTLPIPGYSINVAVTFINGSQENYISNFINDTKGGSMGMFTFNYSELFNEALEPNSIYVLTIFPTNRLGKLLILYTSLQRILYLDTSRFSYAVAMVMYMRMYL